MCSLNVDKAVVMVLIQIKDFWGCATWLEQEKVERCDYTLTSPVPSVTFKSSLRLVWICVWGILSVFIFRLIILKSSWNMETNVRQFPTIMNPNDPISIIPTAIRFSATGADGGRFRHPSPLRRACQRASRAERRREIGHDEAAANKAEDGETSATRPDEAKQPARPEPESGHSSHAPGRKWQLAGSSSFQVGRLCPEQYWAPVSSSFTRKVWIKHGHLFASGGVIRLRAVPDTCFYLFLIKIAARLIGGDGRLASR